MADRWTIRIRYQTGDSFSSSFESTELPITWESVDNAKAALKRIKDRFYSVLYHGSDTERWLWEMEFGDAPPPPEPKDTEGWVGEEPIMTLKLDDGFEHKIHLFWEGAFEQLEEARVVLADAPDHEEDMIFQP